ASPTIRPLSARAEPTPIPASPPPIASIAPTQPAKTILREPAPIHPANHLAPANPIPRATSVALVISLHRAAPIVPRPAPTPRPHAVPIAPHPPAPSPPPTAAAVTPPSPEAAAASPAAV